MATIHVTTRDKLANAGKLFGSEVVHYVHVAAVACDGHPTTLALVADDLEELCDGLARHWCDWKGLPDHCALVLVAVGSHVEHAASCMHIEDSYRRACAAAALVAFGRTGDAERFTTSETGADSSFVIQAKRNAPSLSAALDSVIPAGRVPCPCWQLPGTGGCRHCAVVERHPRKVAVALWGHERNLARLRAAKGAGGATGGGASGGAGGGASGGAGEDIGAQRRAVLAGLSAMASVEVFRRLSLMNAAPCVEGPCAHCTIPIEYASDNGY